jgi:hypothetical protein
MIKTVWFIVALVSNPIVGDDGEAFISQQMLHPHPTDTLRSYDECKTHLYKVMEEGGEGWRISTSKFRDASHLVLRDTNTPPEVIKQYTCVPFKVDMEALKTIK